MNNTIIIFTMLGCPYCEDLKNELNNLNIPYKEFQIHKYKFIWEQVVKQTGLRNLPTIFIKEGESEFGPVYIPGRDFKNKKEIIQIIKKYI